MLDILIILFQSAILVAGMTIGCSELLFRCEDYRTYHRRYNFCSWDWWVDNVLGVAFGTMLVLFGALGIAYLVVR